MRTPWGKQAQDAGPSTASFGPAPGRWTAIAALCVASLVTGACGTALPDPQVSSTPAPVPLRIGVSLASQHYDVPAIAAWEAAVGHRADVVQTFVPWSYEASPGLTQFPTELALQISEGGRVLEVTWTPAEPSEGEGQPGIPLSAIADGDYDGYVREFARAVADSGLPVRMRFAHEMNGTWSRWSETRPDNEPGDFVRAWRHLHDLFAEEGAQAVTWVWSPNVVGTSTQALAELYPGDSFVDEVAIDGYSYPKASCPSPGALFDPTINEVLDLTDRPVALGEVGVDVGCPDRAEWVTDVYAWAAARQLVGVTWWEREGATGDFRITDDPTTLEAQREAVGKS